jgi:hypothetical protein
MNYSTKNDSFIFNQNASLNNCEVIIETIFSIIKAELNSNYEQDRKMLLNCFLCNLLYVLIVRHYLGIHLNKNQYSYLPVRYRVPYYSYRLMANMVKALKNNGFISYLPNRYFKENKGLNRTKLFYPTERLLEVSGLINTKEITISENDPEIIVLKEKKINGKANLINYKDTKETLTMRRNLEEYNEFISGVKISCNRVKTYNNIQLYNNSINHNINTQFLPYISTFGVNTFIASKLHRVFSNSDFQQGGRFYTSNFGYQNLSKEERETILINGENTVELDYSSMHIYMLYAERNIQYNNDPYSIVPEHPEVRGITKKVFLISINASDRKKAYRAIIKEYPDISDKLRPYNLTLSSLIDKLIQVHNPIADYFFSGQGIYLQNTDSKIMNDILVSSTKLGKPALHVHDSVIVQGKDKNLLKSIMEESYKNNMKGFSCKIKEKEPSH